MTYDSIIFDLDGTLWDTTPACAVSWNNVAARESIAFRPIVTEDVQRVTGRPHEDCIRLAFAGLTDAEIDKLIVGTMAEDNATIERLGGVIYPGVESGLIALKARYRLMIVSNCQSGYIETFLKFSGFGPLFEDFECWGNTLEPKSENLRRVIERNHLTRPIMVGDAEGDERAARACGIPFIHVSYGFGQGLAPDHIFGSFDELVQHFLPAQ